jgi:hypothetical protein
VLMGFGNSAVDTARETKIVGVDDQALHRTQFNRGAASAQRRSNLGR